MIFIELEKFSKKNKIFLVVISFFLVFLLEYLNYNLGYEFSISFLFYLPLILAGWFYGTGAGFIIALLARGVGLANPVILFNKPLSSIGNILWDSLVFLIISGIILYLLSLIKQMSLREKELARIDSLTQLSNQKNFYYLADVEINRAKRFRHPLSIVYIDVDNFKVVNETMGYDVGDLLLKTVASTLKRNIRDYDLSARVGGDEFVILFPEINEIQVKSAVDKVREKLFEMITENNWPVTLSIGVLTFKNLEKVSLEEIIRKSDQLMYSVKKNGKNSIVFLIE